MTISHTLEEIEKEYEEKFPFRIYGIAGEPKTEFLTTENMPDEIKSFIRSSHIKLLEAVLGEVESIGGIANIYDDTLFISKFIVLSILQTTIDDIKK